MQIVRTTYRKDISFGILVIIFTVVFFLAGQLFENHQPHLHGLFNLNMAKALVSIAVIVMVLILWEEILFSVHIKPVDDGLLFRNHGSKLKVQVLMYAVIPVIVAFLYFVFEVSTFRFFSWAVVCTGLPVIGKLRSGIKNYNDYLLMTGSVIRYKNNQLEGTFPIAEVNKISLINDEGNAVHKLQLECRSTKPVTIDLDQMELEDYYQSICDYIKERYSNLLDTVS